jgi:tetratricopeptide (TPR) repeat protein
MARRRLNKKVALIGSGVLLILVVAVVLVIANNPSFISRNPAPFIADGNTAFAAGDFESARRSYGKALGLTRSVQGKIDLYFKLVDVCQRMQDWRTVLGLWGQIVASDPQNLRARMCRLKYSYILADSLSEAGQSLKDCWEESLKQATELLDVATTAGVLDKPRAQWESSFGAAEESRWAACNALLGPCLYFIKGRAAYEVAALGAVASPDELLDQAQSCLQKAKELDPNNADVYDYLAQVILQKGERAASRGNEGAGQAAAKQADDLLAESVRATGGAPQASINVLTRKFAAARTGEVSAARSKMQALQPQYEALVEKFPENPKAWAALAEFHAVCSAYSDPTAAPEALGRAISAAEKACALDKTSVLYARFTSRLYYRKYSLFGDEAALGRAIELSEQGLGLPDAQDVAGPRQYARQANRFSLCVFLSRCYVERLLTLDKSSPQRAELLAEVEKAVREIEQIRGSGQNPQVVMWRGMLELARGRTANAVKSLYAAYEQIKASSPAQERDAFLSYTLGQIFEGTTEVGAVIEFLGSALGAGIIDTKPQALLDYGQALIQARSYDAALNAVGVYEERFGSTSRSKSLRIEALIGTGHTTEAQDAIARLESQDPNVLRLGASVARVRAAQLRAAIRQKTAGENRPIGAAPAGVNNRTNGEQSVQAMTAELRDCQQREADLMQQLLKAAPAAVEEQDAVQLCGALIEQKDAATARKLVDAYLTHAPDSVEALFYRGLLSEPDPSSCTNERRLEIRAEAIRGIADPVRRSVALGAFYQQQEQYDKAVSQWQEVLDATSAKPDEQEPAYLRTRQLGPRHVAASYLFDVARHQKNWKLAQEVVTIARQGGLDDCGGSLFAARLAFAKGDNKEALAHIDDCLRQRPIFSYGYMLRGNIYAAMDNERASIDDLQKAADLNPVDPTVAKALANALYVRNGKLGDKQSSEQQSQARQAIEHAIRLDPRDVGLLTVYAQMVGKDEPMKALALRQTIQINAPSVANAVALGKLATQLATNETDQTKKQGFFAMAESAFEQARKLDPTNQLMLESYAEYYRARGQNDKAAQLLSDAQDSRLLWRHYYRVGRLDEARKLLEQMYAEPKSRVDALKGLVLIAEETADKDSVKKYGEELLSLDDNLVNRLGQIRAYLDVGLIQEARHKLQSFKEKYPQEPQVLLMEALLAKRQGDLDRAFELANRSLQASPNDAAVWRLRGEISSLKGDHDRAIGDLTKSRALEDDPVTTMVLAKAYVRAGRDEQAVAELQGILDKPGTPPQARVLLGSIYQKLGRSDDLRKLYDDALSQSPDNVEWLSRAAGLAINQRDYARAEQLYEKAYQIEQQDTSNRPLNEAVGDRQYVAALDGYLLALILGAGQPGGTGDTWRPEKLDKVLQVAEKYVDTSYGPAALCRMAEAKKKRGDREAARDDCRRAMDKAWDDERTAAEVLLRVYLLMGGDEVSAYCRQKLQTAPDSLPANYAMFNLAKIKEDYNEADDYIDKCIALCPSGTPAHYEHLAQKAQLLAIAYKKTSDNAYLEKAIAAYESLLEKTPKNDNNVVLNNLAYMLAQSGRRLADALEYAKTALEQKPDEANYLDTYGYVLYRSGRNADALASLTAAVQQYEAEGTSSAEVYEHLGLVHEALGDKPKALAAYRRAVEIGAGTMPKLMKDRIDSAMSRLAQ